MIYKGIKPTKQSMSPFKKSPTNISRRKSKQEGSDTGLKLPQVVSANHLTGNSICTSVHSAIQEDQIGSEKNF
jgi:hypothetical protein